MTKIILAFDSFKGSVSSTEISHAIGEAIRSEMPACELQTVPVADGGEGTTEAICSALAVNWITRQVHNPLMEPVEASYAITQDGETAIIEMASASGLPLIAPERRNPLYTTTYGTGELIADALNRGCRQFILGLGGSATNDAGIGMMNALGVRFLDKKGNELSPIGINLPLIEQIDETTIHSALSASTFTIACDVKNTLYGKEGAAYIFAPQKGAHADDVVLLDKGLRHYAKKVLEIKGIDIASIPGSGAAGGMGGGILPYLNASLKSGIDTILDILQFDHMLDDAQLVFTGEGKIDAQTGMGKALNGILQKARAKNVPVIALAGSVENAKILNKLGFTAVFSIQQGPISLHKAMQKDTALKNILMLP